MSQEELLVIDGFLNKKENKVEENFQFIVSTHAIYLVKSSVNYGKYVKSIFSGVGDLLGFFGSGAGIISGLASELTGVKLSEYLKNYAANSSKNNMAKIISNLDKLSSKKKGITKIEWTQLEQLTVKKGYLINGASAVEFMLNKEISRFETKERKNISALIEAIESKNESVKINSTFL